MATLLVENPILDGVSAAQRFQSRIPPASARRESLIRSLALIPQSTSRVLAFNVNTIADSKSTPLSKILLTQWYLAKGYSGNVLFARVIEAELNKRGLLQALHDAAARIAGKPWPEIVANPSYYSQALYAATC